MFVSGVEVAPINNAEYEDGWFRTFGAVPEFTEQELDLLHEYMTNEQLEEIVIYLEKYRDITGYEAEFVLRELMRGNA